MKLRFRIYLLGVIFTFLGAVLQQQNVVPNQEIVLQFNDVEITPFEAENAVADLAKQLESLGIDSIQVNKKEDGKLVISYYSNVDVVHIKNALSNGQVLDVDLENSGQNNSHTQLPSQENSISYNLDIYEIQSNNDIESNLNGSVVELNLFSDKLLNPNVYSSGNSVDVTEKDNSVKVAFKVYTNIAIAIDNTSYVIPEVRAGPSA